jgi:hypothetical protein
MTCPLGDPFLSLYTPEKKGYKQNILFGTITISSTSYNLMIYTLILWASPPHMVRPMYHLVVPGVYTPTHCDLGRCRDLIQGPRLLRTTLYYFLTMTLHARNQVTAPHRASWSAPPSSIWRPSPLPPVPRGGRQVVLALRPQSLRKRHQLPPSAPFPPFVEVREKGKE